ncbi:hypothetical protein [Sneathiella sp. HT1-7]|nr:hypothetical protein [Sneathiella sp. HT1-7]
MVLRGHHPVGTRHIYSLYYLSVIADPKSE